MRYKNTDAVAIKEKVENPMIDRLNELLRYAPWDRDKLAEFLIANGVIVQAQGRWVTEGKIFYCSNCRFTRNIEVYINHRYCPHCGAKMERSNENAD